LTNQLSVEEVDDEARLKEVVLAYAELMANIPDKDIASINEEFTRLHYSCKNLKRQSFYLETIKVYCAKSKNNYESHAAEYLENTI